VHEGDPNGDIRADASAAEQTDEREPECAGWLASLEHVNPRPRYPKR
jgi:hypothetical protein